VPKQTVQTDSGVGPRLLGAESAIGMVVGFGGRPDLISPASRRRRSRRRAVVARLTGALAHDFNNILTIVIGGAESLLAERPDDPDVRELAEMIRDAGDSGQALMDQLQAFARREAP
jgi:signal transduction histidine kinase